MAAKTAAGPVCLLQTGCFFKKIIIIIIIMDQ